MRSLLTRSRDESGQVFVFVALFLTFLVGMSALVVDVGSWYQAQRHLQTAADAAALAGAQKLPVGDADDCGDAEDCAIKYGQRNNVVIEPEDVNFPNTYTIEVVADTEDLPGIFFPMVNALFGDALFDGVDAHARAAAEVRAPLELKNVAPVGVHVSEACIVTSPSCFEDPDPKELAFEEDDPFDPTKSKFGFLQLDRVTGGGADELAEMLEDGYPGYLQINTDYPVMTGNKNGQKIEDAFEALVGDTILLPVYDTASLSAGYHIIGWAALELEDVEWTNKKKVLTGHFVTFIATDLAAGDTISNPNLDFGVHVITLTK